MPTDVPLLTKSDYLAGLHCPKRLYLKKYHREFETPPDAGAKDRMASGLEVGALARLLFPGGLMIEGSGAEAQEATQILMIDAHTLFEAQFESGGRMARVDVLQRSGEGWRLLEVKSSVEPQEGGKPKPEHLEDIAFQLLVLKDAGVNVTSLGLILLNRQYRAPAGGGIDPRAAFSIVDVTDQVHRVLVDAEFRSIAMIRTLSADTAPEIEPNTYCKDCGFYDHCNGDLEKDDLLFLPGIRAQQISQLRKDGIHSIAKVPDTIKLNAQQVRVRDVCRSQTAFISDGLADELAALRFPIYFVDFETCGWALPMLAGTAPHQTIPFQWSCHTLEADGALGHTEFLWHESEDPRPNFARSLFEALKSAGSVVVYSPFELTRVRALAEEAVPLGADLRNLFEQRAVDLLKIVRDNLYFPAFQGSYSIKSVLPALVPGMSYDDLSIREGNQASAAFKRMIAPTTPSEAKAEIARDLLAYCKRDTEAMVELYAAMGRLTGSHSLPVSEPGPDDTKHDQLILNI